MKASAIKKYFLSFLIFFYFNSLSIADEECLSFSADPIELALQEVSTYENKSRILTIDRVEFNNGSIFEATLKLNESEKFEVISYSELSQHATEVYGNVVKYNNVTRILTIPIIQTNDSFIENTELKLNPLGFFEIINYSPNNCKNRITLNKYNLIDSSMTLEQVENIIGVYSPSIHGVNSDLISMHSFRDTFRRYVLPRIWVEFRYGKVIKKSYKDIFKDEVFKKFNNSFCDESPKAPVCLNPSGGSSFCDDFPMLAACTTPDIDFDDLPDFNTIEIKNF
jgi:hypothetical protein